MDEGPPENFELNSWLQLNTNDMCEDPNAIVQQCVRIIYSDENGTQAFYYIIL